MNEMFITKLLNMSLTGGAVILVAVVLRLLLRRMPKKYSCLLWMLALVRLLCPFTITSPLSLLPAGGESLMEMAADGGTVPRLDTGIHATNNLVNVEFLNGLLPEATVPSDSSLGLLDDFGVLGDLRIFGILWISGLVIFAGVNLMRYGRMKRILRDSSAGGDGAYYSDKISMPMVLGFLKPCIYLPASFLTEEREDDKSFVLAHERCHIKRKDHLVKLLAFAALAVHWFNPLVWLAFILLCKDLEMACDECVLEELGEENKRGYSLALLHFAEKNSGLFIRLAFGESHTESRIKNILNYKKPSFWIGAAILVLLIGAAVTLLTDPEKPDADKEPDIAVKETEETQANDSSAVTVIGGADGPTSIFVAEKVEEKGSPAAPLDLETAKSQPYGMAVELDYVRGGAISMHGSFGFLSFGINQNGDNQLFSELKYAVSLEEAGPIQMQGDGYTEVFGAEEGAIVIPNFYNTQAESRQMYVYNGQLNTVSGPMEFPADFGMAEEGLKDAPIEDEHFEKLSGLVREQYKSQVIYGPVAVPEYNTNVYGFLAADGENLEDVWYGLWWQGSSQITRIPLFEK